MLRGDSMPRFTSKQINTDVQIKICQPERGIENIKYFSRVGIKFTVADLCAMTGLKKNIKFIYYFLGHIFQNIYR